MLISYKSLLIAVVAISFAATSPQLDVSLELDLDAQNVCNNANDEGELCELNNNDPNDNNFGFCIGNTCTACSANVACHANSDANCFLPSAPAGVFNLPAYCLPKCNDGTCDDQQFICGGATRNHACFVDDNGTGSNGLGFCNGGARRGEPCMKTVAGVTITGLCFKPAGRGYCKTCNNASGGTGCPPGSTCVADECVPNPSTTTSSTPPASSTTSTTPTTTSTPCNPYDDKCPAGQYCHKGSKTCKAGCKKKGSTCTKDGKTGKCKDNHTCDVSGKQKGSKCSTKKNNDCGSGLKCVKHGYSHNGRCHPVAGANKSCGKGTYYSVCANGYKCKGHKCKKSY